jgi:hypothetical protein
MSCVTAVRYSVRLNGVPLESFQPTRGVCEGDPLSPYLFLFVADALSTALQQEIQGNALQELKISRHAPGISHLMFADDALLFFKADVSQARLIKNVLNRFERGTGQQLSPAKCSLLARESLDDQRKVGIREVLGVDRAEFEAKYLGLPTPEGRQKKDRFQPLRERFGKWMALWTEKHLATTAKEVLIKVVAQAIPTYTMSIFHLTGSLCEELAQGVRRYWWGAHEGVCKTHWIAWEKITRCKGRGGLGFRDFQVFNQALPAKQAWRLIEFPGSLCVRLLKAKYFPIGDILDTAFPSQVSPTWKAIAHGLELLKKGTVWRIARTGQKLKSGGINGSRGAGPLNPREVVDCADLNGFPS